MKIDEIKIMVEEITEAKYTKMKEYVDSLSYDRLVDDLTAKDTMKKIDEIHTTSKTTNNFLYGNPETKEDGFVMWVKNNLATLFEFKEYTSKIIYKTIGVASVSMLIITPILAFIFKLIFKI